MFFEGFILLFFWVFLFHNFSWAKNFIFILLNLFQIFDFWFLFFVGCFRWFRINSLYLIQSFLSFNFNWRFNYINFPLRRRTRLFQHWKQTVDLNRIFGHSFWFGFSFFFWCNILIYNIGFFIFLKLNKRLIDYWSIVQNFMSNFLLIQYFIKWRVCLVPINDRLRNWNFINLITLKTCSFQNGKKTIIWNLGLLKQTRFWRLYNSYSNYVIHLV